MHFDQKERIFESTFAVDTTLPPKAHSEIYINKNFWYPNDNYTITISFADYPDFLSDYDSTSFVHGKTVKRLKNDNVIRIRIDGGQNNNRWIKVRVEPEVKHDIYDLSRFGPKLMPEEERGIDDPLFGPVDYDGAHDELESIFPSDNGQVLLAKSI